MRTIDLSSYSRANRNLKLIPVESGVWEFKAEAPDEWVMEYLRIGFDEDGVVLFIDPSDGPYICTGDEIDNIIINKIESKDRKILIYAEDKEEV